MAEIPLTPEDVLRSTLETDDVGRQTLSVFDLWHDECKRVLGADVEIVLADRHDDARFRSYDAEFNTAAPETDQNGRVVLVLYVDNRNHVEDLILTHELGHWILNLRGFSGIALWRERNSDTELVLGSLVQHPALYDLQRNHGFEPVEEIEKRLEFHVSRLERSGREAGGDISLTSLRLVDDLISATPALSREVRDRSRIADPEVADTVDLCLSEAEHYDLLDPEGCRRFARRVITKLSISEHWGFVDNARYLRSLIEAASRSE